MSSLVVVDVLDAIGVLAFALSGAALGARHRFDVIGVLTLAMTTGLAGGVLRDLLLGLTPPVALVEQERLAVPLIAVAIVAVMPDVLHRLSRPVLVLDAVGLGLFAVVGAQRAAEAGLGFAASTIVGAVSAAGGGVIRDVMVGRTPIVFTSGSGLYVTAASFGAFVAAIATATIPGSQSAGLAAAVVAAAVTVVVIRLTSLQFGWRAPTLPAATGAQTDTQSNASGVAGAEPQPTATRTRPTTRGTK